MSRLSKKSQRLRRSMRTRCAIRRLRVARLAVFRSAKHFYGQIILPSDKGDVVIAEASSLQKECLSGEFYSGNQQAAREVGQHLAKRALAKGITKVAFDRSGFKYHGRVKAFAEGAREAGLIF